MAGTVSDLGPNLNLAFGPAYDVYRRENLDAGTGFFLRGLAMKNTKRKKVPEFRSEDDERRFWATADSTYYVDWSSAKRAKHVRLKRASGRAAAKGNHARAKNIDAPPAIT